MLKNLDDRYWFYFWKLFWNSFKMHTLRSQSGNIHISIIRSNQENIFYQCPLISLNTLHNTKRLGPFLGFGCNFGEKQNKCLKMDRKSVCLMWFVQVFCLFASWANPNCLLIIPKTQKRTQTKCTTFAQICWFLDTHPVLPKNYTQNPKTDPNVWNCVKCLVKLK